MSEDERSVLELRGKWRSTGSELTRTGVMWVSQEYVFEFGENGEFTIDCPNERHAERRRTRSTGRVVEASEHRAKVEWRWVTPENKGFYYRGEMVATGTPGVATLSGEWNCRPDYNPMETLSGNFSFEMFAEWASSLHTTAEELVDAKDNAVEESDVLPPWFLALFRRPLLALNVACRGVLAHFLEGDPLMWFAVAYLLSGIVLYVVDFVIACTKLSSRQVASSNKYDIKFPAWNTHLGILETVLCMCVILCPILFVFRPDLLEVPFEVYEPSTGVLAAIGCTAIVADLGQLLCIKASRSNDPSRKEASKIAPWSERGVFSIVRRPDVVLSVVSLLAFSMVFYLCKRRVILLPLFLYAGIAVLRAVLRDTQIMFASRLYLTYTERVKYLLVPRAF